MAETNCHTTARDPNLDTPPGLSASERETARYVGVVIDDLIRRLNTLPVQREYDMATRALRDARRWLLSRSTSQR
jgi:hypothetical protein